MRNILNFNKMITPQIIKILFVIGLLFAIVYGFGVFALGIKAGEGLIILSGLLALVIGPILVRVYCELLIIMFKIHETLDDIKNEIRNK